MNIKANTVEIAPGIHWVGMNDIDKGLHCNPYLLIDGEEAVLIDPGSVLDFEQVYQNVTSLVPLEKIKYVVLNHQDPDLCSSVPLFEKKGLKAEIATHWRTATLVRYYGITSPYYLVNEKQYSLTLSSGRELCFMQTPYLHFPGAIVVYDKKSKILFSSDLFGAFTYQWELFANDDYVEPMKAFHEHYMPGNDILRPVMESFLSMDIEMIAPQHGSIIKENVKKYIHILKDLECGIFLNPIKRELLKSGGYESVCNQVLKRYRSVFSHDDVFNIFQDSNIEINYETMEIKDYLSTGEELWDNLFNIIYAKKGLGWFSVIEPVIKRITKEYDIKEPAVFSSIFLNYNVIDDENRTLRQLNDTLQNNIKQVEDKLIRDPISSLYNENFFLNFLQNQFAAKQEDHIPLQSGILFIEIDNIQKITFTQGISFGNEMIKNAAYLINELKLDNHLLFRYDGPGFVYFIPGASKEEYIKIAENIRNAIETSNMFLEKTTASIGVVDLKEITYSTNVEDMVSKSYALGLLRISIAKNKGMNYVCSESATDEYYNSIGKILIVDTDLFHIDILKTALQGQQFQVFTAQDGKEAFEMVEINLPDLIVSEIMLPKQDGFILKEQLSRSSRTKSIPLILISHLKDNASVERAISLQIEHYFQKPYMLSEVLGIIKNKVLHRGSLA